MLQPTETTDSLSIMTDGELYAWFRNNLRSDPTVATEAGPSYQLTIDSQEVHAKDTYELFAALRNRVLQLRAARLQR